MRRVLEELRAFSSNCYSKAVCLRPDIDGGQVLTQRRRPEHFTQSTLLHQDVLNDVVDVVLADLRDHALPVLRCLFSSYQVLLGLNSFVDTPVYDAKLLESFLQLQVLEDTRAILKDLR